MIEYSLDQINSVKANVDSPAFTGIPTAPTASVGTNTTQIATTSFVTAANNFYVKKGEFLLGVNAPLITDANAVATTQWNQVGDTWTGSLFSGSNGRNQGYLFTQVWNTSNTYRLQTFYNIGGEYISAWRRMDNGVWSSWVFNWTYGTPNGRVLIGTTTDNGVDALQVSGTVSETAIPIIIADLNTLTTLTKKYIMSASSANLPLSNETCFLETFSYNGGNYCLQRATAFGTSSQDNGGRVFSRMVMGFSTWTSWKELTN
jgi:hypothetical protein